MFLISLKLAGEEIGKMLMAYEEFQVKLEMMDPYEEIEWEPEAEEELK
ncbi:hypothetical protein QOZ98_001623 [Planomicrobium stackebrandtii]|uniref:DUF7713 domain-containing protein n=1 Tax=Planomicrobium stackebrandtii TaxID=253160 RepID=A0ABU0GVI9_9BACL|nr:hypothetical protein [Planomicrobium stackebrandtii]MDQ0428796.1 hypothetical protein [Planomicrobium stackebrandtii]